MDTVLHPRRYTVKNLFRRLGRREDPWNGMGRRRRSLDSPGKILDGILEDEGDRNFTLEKGDDDDGS